MKTRLLFFTVILAATLFSLTPRSLAQTLPFVSTGGSGSTAVDFEFRLDGSIYERGSGSTSLTTSDLQASSVFLWYPALKALRAGGNSTETPSTLGQYSVAMGNGSSASGQGAVAMGINSSASGQGAVALGANSRAVQAGDFAFAGATANGGSCFAMGFMTSSTGGSSTALGPFCGASGAGSLAEGFTCDATAICSGAIGYEANATGNYSMALGYYTNAHAYAAMAIGQYNVGSTAVSSNSWVLTDPLFEIGNGTSSSAKSDALVVYKNGNAVFSPPAGTASCTVSAPVFVTTTPGGSGDIPMYAGN